MVELMAKNTSKLSDGRDLVESQMSRLVSLLEVEAAAALKSDDVVSLAVRNCTDHADCPAGEYCYKCEGEYCDSDPACLGCEYLGLHLSSYMYSCDAIDDDCCSAAGEDRGGRGQGGGAVP